MTGRSGERDQLEERNNSLVPDVTYTLFWYLLRCIYISRTTSLFSTKIRRSLVLLLSCRAYGAVFMVTWRENSVTSSTRPLADSINYRFINDTKSHYRKTSTGELLWRYCCIAVLFKRTINKTRRFRQ